MTVNITALIVGPDHPIPIEPLGGTATVTVKDGGPVFYSDTLPVSASSNQGSITAGNSQQFSANSWIISGSYSGVSVLVDSAGLSPILTDTSLRTVRGSGKAAGDGTTDDAAQIAVQDAAAAASGATLFFPGPATYMIGSSITPAANWLFAPGATLKKRSSFAAAQAIQVTAANLRLENVTVDGNRSGGAAGQGIVWSGAGGTLVRPNVQHNALTGVRCTGAGATLDIYDGVSSDNQSGSNTADGFYCLSGGQLRLQGDCRGENNDRHGCFISNGAAQNCVVNGRFNNNNGSSSCGVLIRESYVNSQYIEVRNNNVNGVQTDFGASRCRFGFVVGRDQGLTALNTNTSDFQITGGYDVRLNDLQSWRCPGYALDFAGYHVSATTANGAILIGDTSIVLTSAAGLPSAGALLIEDEVVFYTGISTNTLTGVTRGQMGTAAAAHVTLVSVLNPQQTTLSGALGAGDVTINVATTGNFPSAGLLKHGAEFITYEGVTATSFTGCARGVFGTTAATGANTDPIMLNHGSRSCDIGRMDGDNQGVWSNNPSVVFVGGSSHNTIRKLRTVGHTCAVSIGEQPLPNGNDWNIFDEIVAEQCSFAIVKCNRGSHNRFGKVKGRDCWNSSSPIANSLMCFDPTLSPTPGVGVVTDNVTDSFEHFTLLRPGPLATITNQNGATGCYIQGTATTSSWEPGIGVSTIPRHLVQNNLGAALTSQTLHVFGGIVLPAGKTVTSITFVSGTTALATGVNQWFCIIDPVALKILAVTGDDTSNAWAANSAKTLNLAATYMGTQDQAVALGVMVNATTPPTLLGIDMNSQQAPIANANLKRAATSSTAQTTPLAVGTAVSGFTSNRIYGYGYLS